MRPKSAIVVRLLSETGCTSQAPWGQGETVQDQCTSALATIEAALKEAGCGFADVVRVTYMLPDRADFEPCWPILSATFGAHPPAATMIQCGLIDDAFRIEVEVTAYRAGRDN